MRRTKQKFYDRYYSLGSYKTINYEDEEVFYHIIKIPKKENFKQHLENVRRLLEIEYGGVFEIEFWDENERTIETNIPYRVYYGFQDYQDFLSDEENEKIDIFWRYKITGETVIQKLW